MNVLVHNVRRKILSFCWKSEEKLINHYCFSRRFSNKEQATTKMRKILNVAEKNDVAKRVSSILSGGRNTIVRIPITNSENLFSSKTKLKFSFSLFQRNGKSQYNKIYEFQCQVLNQQCQMVMTSVSGHLLNYDFTSDFTKWNSCLPVELFDAPVVKQCPINKQTNMHAKNAPPDSRLIKQTLEMEIRSCDTLIIWTDCDREGENIGFEIIDVCQKVKRNITVYRAKFSEITPQAIFRAINNLGVPNKAVSDAVDVRSELDLRIGD